VSAGISKLPENTNLPAAFAEIQAKLPGMVEILEPMHPGMHTTETVDFDVVLSGEVYPEFDDSSEVLLKAGDCVVQNGTRHAWQNRSAKDCGLAVALIGAQRGRRSNPKKFPWLCEAARKVSACTTPN
jgi:hypothetical protein